MPSVLPPYKGWRVVIYTNDHRPPHVHIVGAQVKARFELLCDLGQVRLMSQIGLTHSQAQQIASYLTTHIGQLCNEWRRIHGR